VLDEDESSVVAVLHKDEFSVLEQTFTYYNSNTFKNKTIILKAMLYTEHRTACQLTY